MLTWTGAALKQKTDLSDEIELAVRQQALSGDLPLPFGSNDDQDGTGEESEEEI